MKQETKDMVLDGYEEIAISQQRILEALESAKKAGKIKILVTLGENIARLVLLKGLNNEMCYFVKVSGRNNGTAEQLNHNPHELILKTNDINLDNIHSELPNFMGSYYQDFIDLPIYIFTRRPTTHKQIPPVKIISANQR